MVAKTTKKTITHSHRHGHDGQEHTHQHARKPSQKSHNHEHEHDVILYSDERGYTIIRKLKDLDMDDLKLWKEDEVE